MRPRVSHCPAQAYPLLCGLRTSYFFLLPQPVPKQIGTHSPMLHLETQTHSTFLFSLFHSFLYYLSHVYHYGSYTLAVEKHTGRINIFFRYIFIICWSSNYLFYINSEDILNYDLKPVRTAPQFWITERKKKKKQHPISLSVALFLSLYAHISIFCHQTHRVQKQHWLPVNVPIAILAKFHCCWLSAYLNGPAGPFPLMLQVSVHSREQLRLHGHLSECLFTEVT